MTINKLAILETIKKSLFINSNKDFALNKLENQ